MSFFYKENPETGREVLRTNRVRALTGGGIALVVFLVVWLFASPFAKVPNGYIGLSYGGGIFEGQHFQGEHSGPTSLFFNGPGDHLYLYPTTLRNYIISSVASEGDREGSDSIVALDSEGVPVTYEVAVYFKLNVDLAAQFHTSIGLKYHAWCDSGATNCSDGWEEMLNATMRQQLENALQAASRTHTTSEFLQTETIRLIQGQIEANLKDNVNKVLGDGDDAEYFCGPDYVAGSDECPDFSLVIKTATLPQDVVTEYQNVQESKIAIETKRNEVVQAELEAEAIEKRQKALESCGETCVLYEAIKAGSIDFWVIPSGQEGLNLTLPTKGAGG